jgi:hypothetical protein
MARNLTQSPLNLTTIDNVSNNTDSEFETPFSAWKDDNKKHFLRKSNRKFSGILSDSRHSNDVYNIGTQNIIDQLNKVGHLSLSAFDFAYNSEFGVYPNNRLIVCRRFHTGVVDDLYSLSDEKVGKPRSTVIGYIKDEDFLNFQFSEEWGNAEVSFTKLLNDISADFGFKQFKMGDILEGGIDAIPIPGASLLLQRQIMASLGLFGEGVTFNPTTGNFVNPNGTRADVSTIPQGDPNLIKEAKVRKLIGDNETGSGLKCTFSIKFTVKYEQKYIGGIDPTIAYAQIIHNLLNMGTSPASFYLGKQNDLDDNVGKYLEKLIDNPGKVITELINSIIKVIKDQTTRLGKVLDKKSEDDDRGFFEIVGDFVFGGEEETTNAGDGASKILGDASTLITKALEAVPEYVKNFIKNKYRLQFYGIINSLTGGPSTPWHVTIGNPLRPIFCSGDMLCRSVDVKLSSQLSFNDLPTFIEATISLESARELGLQEIFAKLNSGGIRVLEGDGDADNNYVVSTSSDFFSNSLNSGTSSNNTSGSTSDIGTQLQDFASREDFSVDAIRNFIQASGITKEQIAQYAWGLTLPIFTKADLIAGINNL